MALEESVVPVAMGQGINTKADPKALNPGKLLLLENGVFTQANRVSKRNGYTAISDRLTGGGSLPNALTWNAKTPNQKGMIVGDGYNIYEHSPDVPVYTQIGNYTSASLTESTIFNSGGLTTNSDAAVVGNYYVYAYVYSASGAATQAVCSVYDASTFSYIGSVSVSDVTYVRVCALAGSTIGFFYVNGSQDVVGSTISVSVSGVSQANVTTINSTDVVNFDIIPMSSGAAVLALCNTGANSAIYTVDSTVSVTHSAAISVGNGTVKIGSMTQDPSSGNIFAYYQDPALTNLYYAVFSSTLSVVLAKTLIVASSNSIHTVIGVPTATTNRQSMYFSDFYADPTTSANIDRIRTATVNSTGTVGTVSVVNYGTMVVSHPFLVGSAYYALEYSRITGNRTFFVTALNTNTSNTLNSGSVIGRIFAQSAGDSNMGGGERVLCSAALVGSTAALFLLPQTFAIQQAGFVTLSELAAVSVLVDFSDANSNMATEAGQGIVLNGASPQFYDGVTSSELGFNLFPVIYTTAQAATGGFVVSGSYLYSAVYQWTDANGNLHQSEPSSITTVTVNAGSTNKVTVYTSNLYLTDKDNVTIALFRSTANGVASTLYQISSATVQTKSDPAAAIATIVDTFADTTITNNAQLYTNGGVLENGPAPASMIMSGRNSRLWMVNSEDQNELVYTKTFTPGFGLSPSPSLSLQVDTRQGPVTAISEMDEKMVLFKKQAPYWFSGDGADDTGANSTLSVPQPLPSDSGCDQFKSLILFPGGIIRHSQKGFYLLSRSLQDQYFGFEVQDYNAQTFTSAVITPSVNQIRLLAASGSALVYDYVMAQWGVFTNHLGLSAVSYQDKYTYIRVNGSVYQEDANTFLDSATSYRLRAQTAWIKMASIQGYQRLRRMVLLGDYRTGVSGANWGVQASFAYDYGTTFTTPVIYNPGAASTSGVLEYRERFPQQKCAALTILIEETGSSGVSGSFLDLTDLSFEVGVKKGVRKMPLTQTV